MVLAKSGEGEYDASLQLLFWYAPEHYINGRDTRTYMHIYLAHTEECSRKRGQIQERGTLKSIQEETLKKNFQLYNGMN